MKSSLVPEKPILVYPSLAATVGLDESIMLSVLAEITAHLQARTSNGYNWFTLSVAQLGEALPFWQTRDLQRVSTSLRDKGIIIVASAPLASDDTLKFAFNEKSSRRAAPPAAQASAPRPAAATDTPAFLTKAIIAANWQPDSDTLTQLAQLSVPGEFALRQVPEFVTYWRERGEAHHSWGSKFIQRTLIQWRDFEAKQNHQQAQRHMHGDWRPSPDAMDVLVGHAGIRREFVEDAIPEFILYWSERGDKLQTWNSKFIQHVRLQWKKFNSALEHSTDPKPIASNWQPSPDVYDVLRLANIDLHFAQQLIPEFVLYWRDSNQLHTSWNTRYLQHVKHQWAKRHQISDAFTAGQNPNIDRRSTRDISLEEQLTDRSWAN